MLPLLLLSKGATRGRVKGGAQPGGELRGLKLPNPLSQVKVEKKIRSFNF